MMQTYGLVYKNTSSLQRSIVKNLIQQEKNKLLSHSSIHIKLEYVKVALENNILLIYCGMNQWLKRDSFSISFRHMLKTQALSRANSDMRLRKKEEWCNILKITQEKPLTCLNVTDLNNNKKNNNKKTVLFSCC